MTATLASWIVERVAKADRDSAAATRGQIRELSAQIAELKSMLEDRAAS